MSRPSFAMRLTPGRLALFLCALYLLIGLSWPDARHFSGDGDAKHVQVLALRWDHGLRVDYVWPGASFDPGKIMIPLGFSYIGRFGDEVRLAWPLAFSFLSWPFQALLGPRGLFILPAITGALSAYLTGRIAEHVQRGSGTRALLLAGLATPMFFYSVLFWEHLPALSVALLGVYWIVSVPERGGWIRLLLAGASLAAAAGAFRSDFYVFAAAVIGGAFFAWPGFTRVTRCVAVGIGAVVGSLPWFLLNYRMAGHILPLNAVNNTAAPSAAYLLRAKLAVLPHYLVGTSIPERARWIFTIAAVVTFVVVRLVPRRTWLCVAVLGLWLVAGVVCFETLVVTQTRYLHGWLMASPALLYAVLAPRPKDGAPVASRIVGGAVLLHLTADFVLLVTCYPHGFTEDVNLEWGPRYYLGVFPLLAILAAQRLPVFLADRRTRVPVLATAALSVGVQVLGLTNVRGSTLASARIARLLAGPDDTALVSDVWFLPALQHEAMFRRPCFTLFLEGKAFFPGLLERLAARGIRRVQVVSYVGWNDHPFSQVPFPSGLRLTLERQDETDLVKSMWLRIENTAAEQALPR